MSEPGSYEHELARGMGRAVAHDYLVPLPRETADKASYEGLPQSVSGLTINRFCSSGTEALAIAAAKLECGMLDVAVAGGTESMSLIGPGGNKVSPDPTRADERPEIVIGMGAMADSCIASAAGAAAISIMPPPPPRPPSCCASDDESRRTTVPRACQLLMPDAIPR